MSPHSARDWDTSFIASKPRQLAMETEFYDVLSDAGASLLRAQERTSYAELVVHGNGNPTAAKALRAMTGADLLKAKPTRAQPAELLVAGLWLWHDWLDESHRISQRVETADGSYWHAIMHRREGDFSNSKY